MTQKHVAVSSVRRTRTSCTAGTVRHPLANDRQATQRSLAIMLDRIERSEGRSKVRTAGKGKSITAATAVICAFAATGMLATNIFLPSFATMAADLHVSSAAITSTISVFLAIFAFGQLIVGPLSDRFGRQIPVL